MLRKFLKVTTAAALGLMAVVLAYGGAVGAEGKDDKLPDIAEIMKKGHAKTDGYVAKIKTASKDGNWEDANKYAKSLVILGEALAKNKAPKGEADSWDKLTKKYVDNTKLVLKGTEDKDTKEVGKGLGGIGQSCGECHKAHKP
jgi:cytochrome c556